MFEDVPSVPGKVGRHHGPSCNQLGFSVMVGKQIHDERLHLLAAKLASLSILDSPPPVYQLAALGAEAALLLYPVGGGIGPEGVVDQPKF